MSCKTGCAVFVCSHLIKEDAGDLAVQWRLEFEVRFEAEPACIGCGTRLKIPYRIQVVKQAAVGHL